MARTTDQPDRIDRYRILAELGRGAMGRVYLAEDPRIGRKIALKVLAQHDGLNEDKKKELLQRFLREARAAGCLNHPGIVTVFDADTDPASGAPYLAMEWIDGRTLSRILQDEGALPIPRVVDLVSQVASALDHAHAQNVVHRDVKPANLLVTSSGAVKVTDFGIAKLASQSLTMTGQMIGTPFYMAPEQITGDPVDGRADLFALGVVAYECLTGEVAFHGDTLANITHKILRVQPPPAASINPAIPKRLGEVLDRALAKRAEDRFQSGKELELELRAVAEEMNGSASPSPQAKGAAAGRPPKERPFDGSSVSLTRVSTWGAGRPRGGGIRRLAGLAALLFLLPLFGTFVLRTVQEQRPEWLADAPPWLSDAPGWMDQALGRMSGLTGWVNEVADRLSEIPDELPERLGAREGRDGGPRDGARPVPLMPAGLPVGESGAPSPSREPEPSPRTVPGPVAEPPRLLPRGFLTLEDLLSGATAPGATAPGATAPRDFVTREDDVEHATLESSASVQDSL